MVPGILASLFWQRKNISGMTVRGAEDFRGLFRVKSFLGKRFEVNLSVSAYNFIPAGWAFAL